MGIIGCNLYKLVISLKLEVSTDKSPKQKDKNMTVLEGFGMLGVGILALIIGGGIAFYVISKVMEEDDKE